MNLKHHQQTIYVLAIVASLALLLRSDYNEEDNLVRVPRHERQDEEEEEVSRSATLQHHSSRQFDPIPSIPWTITPLRHHRANDRDPTGTLTVYLAGEGGMENPARSIFLTDVLSRYGGGRFDYRIVPHAPCNSSCDGTATAAPASHSREDDGDDDDGPCLAVRRPRGPCAYSEMRCTYPKCRTMVTNDERCRHGEYDVREYYSSALEGNKGYLPLGPRHDAWTSLRGMMSSSNTPAAPYNVVKPASRREYAFNAIFSESTNVDGRWTLRRVIDTMRPWGSDLEIYSKISRRWTRDVNDPRALQVGTDEYARVLLDSIFTLSPGGVNPECYRLYEAVEAGSIPVLVRADLHDGDDDGAGGSGAGWVVESGEEIGRRRKRKMRKGEAFACRDSLRGWRDAPVVVLESWSDLYPTVTRLVADSERLDGMQREMRLWYDEYMRGAISKFEDYMIES